MAASDNPTPVQIVIALARAIGMEIIPIGSEGKLFVIRVDGRRAGVIRDEWPWWNAVPPPPPTPQQE